MSLVRVRAIVVCARHGGCSGGRVCACVHACACRTHLPRAGGVTLSDNAQTHAHTHTRKAAVPPRACTASGAKVAPHGCRPWRGLRVRVLLCGSLFLCVRALVQDAVCVWPVGAWVSITGVGVREACVAERWWVDASACARAAVRACLCAPACGRARVFMGARVRVCVRVWRTHAWRCAAALA